jgi:hypothetical protein
MRKMILIATVILLAAAGSRAQDTPGAELPAASLCRPQLDYIGMRFSGSTVSTVRAPFGVVYRFGNH